MPAPLEIILFPDPRLRKRSAPVTKFDADLADLARRMFELMRLGKGVGLAAPQVGINLRMFVMNPTGEPNDDRVYVNPVLSDPADEASDEEGCLSLPEIRAQIPRTLTLRMTAQDLTGQSFEQIETGYIARIWQHEFDHLNGVLITDRMGIGDQFTHRKKLRELEADFAEKNKSTKPRGKAAR